MMFWLLPSELGGFKGSHRQPPEGSSDPIDSGSTIGSWLLGPLPKVKRAFSWQRALPGFGVEGWRRGTGQFCGSKDQDFQRKPFRIEL